MGKNSYSDYLKEQFGGLIDQLKLSDLQKQFLKSRWLDQLIWLEGKAGKSQTMHFRLRLVTIIGGVIIPAMVSLNVNDGRTKEAVFWGTFGLAQVVAISAAVEEFFHYGERWTQYRKTAEMLKTEGWQFFQLSGPYHASKTHNGAYRSFADRVEKLIQEDVSAITEVMQDDDDDRDEENQRAYELARTIGKNRPMPPPPPPTPRPSYPMQPATPSAPPAYTASNAAPGYDTAISGDFSGDMTPPPAPITSSPPTSGQPRVTAPPPPEINDPKLQNLNAPPGEPVAPRSQ